MELTIGVAVGSSIQIAAGMIPLLVIIAWPLQKNLTLFFVSFLSEPESCLLSLPTIFSGVDSYQTITQNEILVIESKL
jgi:Ca2+/H+ antiporter